MLQFNIALLIVLTVVAIVEIVFAVFLLKNKKNNNEILVRHDDYTIQNFIDMDNYSDDYDPSTECEGCIKSMKGERCNHIISKFIDINCTKEDILSIASENSTIKATIDICTDMVIDKLKKAVADIEILACLEQYDQDTLRTEITVHIESYIKVNNLAPAIIKSLNKSSDGFNHTIDEVISVRRTPGNMSDMINQFYNEL